MHLTDEKTINNLTESSSLTREQVTKFLELTVPTTPHGLCKFYLDRFTWLRVTRDWKTVRGLDEWELVRSESTKDLEFFFNKKSTHKASRRIQDHQIMGPRLYLDKNVVEGMMGVFYEALQKALDEYGEKGDSEDEDWMEYEARETAMEHDYERQEWSD